MGEEVFGGEVWPGRDVSQLVVYSDQLERLLDVLAKEVRSLQAENPLGRIDIVVPHEAMETWCRMGLAERLGIAANVEFMRLHRFVRRLAGALPPDADGRKIQLMDEALIREHLLFLFFSESGESEVPQELLDYLGQLSCLPADETADAAVSGAAASDRGASPAISRRLQMAAKLSALFVRYDESTDYLTVWQKGGTAGFEEASDLCSEKWQAALWRAVVRRMARQSDRVLSFGELADSAKVPNLSLPHATFFFGLPHMNLAALRLVNALAGLPDRPPLRIFAFNPCREDWSEIRDLKRGIQMDETLLSAEDDDRYHLSGVSGHPLLMSLGRPGREHIRALNELTDCDFVDAFSPPCSEEGDDGSLFDRDAAGRKIEADFSEGETLLRRIQADIRDDVRKIVPWRGGKVAAAGDDSLEVLSFSRIQRECEEVAGRVLALFRQNPALRLRDVAILAASPARKGAYFSRLRTALRELGIPSACSELPGSEVSRLSDAAMRLVRLPLEGFGRSAVMGVLTHPAVMANTPEISRASLVSLIDSLGIFYGLSGEAQQRDGARYLADSADSFEDSKQPAVSMDLFNWSQALTRVALGLSMVGPDAGEDAPFWKKSASKQTPYWPASIPMDMRESVNAWLLMVQSLLADVQFAAEASEDSKEGRDKWQTMEDWAVFVAALVDAFVCAGEGEEKDKASLLLAARELAHTSLRDFDTGTELRVPYSVAASLYLEKLSLRRSAEGHLLCDGVSLMSLSRVLPVEHLFVVGLNAGEFPPENRRDQTDLTWAGISGGRDALRRQFRRFLVPETDEARYLFLTALMSARKSLTLSFQGRDLVTGSARDPASPVWDLMHVASLYLSCEKDAGRTQLVRVLPAWRSDLENFPALRKILGVKPQQRLGESKAAESEEKPGADTLETGADAGRDDGNAHGQYPPAVRRKPDALREREMSANPAAAREAAALVLREIVRTGAGKAQKSLSPSSEMEFQPPIGIAAEIRALSGALPTERAAELAEETLRALSIERSPQPDGADKSAGASPAEIQTPSPRLQLRRVSLHAFEKFLEEPAEGAASALLGLSNEDGDETEDALIHREDEPFSFASNLRKSQLISSLLAPYLAGAAAADDPLVDQGEDAFRKVIRRLQADGVFPAADFGKDEAEKMRTLAVMLRGKLEEKLPSLKSHALKAHRYVFSGGEVVSPFEIPLRSPDFSAQGSLSAAGTSWRLALTGRTQFLGWDKTVGCLVSIQVKSSSSNEQPLIRPLVSALAAIASERFSKFSNQTDGAVPFTCITVFNGGCHKDVFTSVTPDEARRYLFALAQRMLGGLNFYRMPGASAVEKFVKKSDEYGAEVRDSLRTQFSEAKAPSYSCLPASIYRELRGPSDAEMDAAFGSDAPESRWGFVVAKKSGKGKKK